MDKCIRVDLSNGKRVFVRDAVSASYETIDGFRELVCRNRDGRDVARYQADAVVGYGEDWDGPTVATFTPIG